MTFKFAKITVEKGLYKDKVDMMDKLDVLMLVGRLTAEQYQELVSLLEEKKEKKSQDSSETPAP